MTICLRIKIVFSPFPFEWLVLLKCCIINRIVINICLSIKVQIVGSKAVLLSVFLCLSILELQNSCLDRHSLDMIWLKFMRTSTSEEVATLLPVGRYLYFEDPYHREVISL